VQNGSLHWQGVSVSSTGVCECTGLQRGHHIACATERDGSAGRNRLCLNSERSNECTHHPNGPQITVQQDQDRTGGARARGRFADGCPRASAWPQAQAGPRSSRGEKIETPGNRGRLSGRCGVRGIPLGKNQDRFFTVPAASASEY
jgi:hypothetical protein